MKQNKRQQKDATYEIANTAVAYTSMVKFTQSEPVFRTFAEEDTKGRR